MAAVVKAWGARPATLYAMVLSLLCGICGPGRATEPSTTKLLVTEGHDIGYATVAAARTNLESLGLKAAPASNGGVSFLEPDNGTAWTFVAKDDPAYPAVVRYVYTRSTGVLHAELTILCEAPAAQCEKFRSDILENLAQLSKKMAGDPTANCRVNGSAMKCGAEPEH